MFKTSEVDYKSNPEHQDEDNTQEKLEMVENNKGAEKSNTIYNFENEKADKLGNSVINVSTFNGIDNANNQSSTETDVLKSTLESIVKVGIC